MLSLRRIWKGTLWITPSINIENLDPAFEGLPIVGETRLLNLETVITNSFGFGGTNAVIVLRQCHD